MTDAAQLARLPGGLDPVAAVGVVAALLAMTMPLPAILVLGGRWLFWPLVPTTWW